MLQENGKRLSDFTESDSIFNELKESINVLNQKFSNPEQIKSFQFVQGIFPSTREN